ncbi:MAG: sigma-70 family RNA polymerase sigma factor [Planctomycetota bacterium]
MPNAFFDRIRNRLRGIVRRKRRHYKSARFDTSDVLQESLLQLMNDYSDVSDDGSAVSMGLLDRIASGHLAKQLRYHHAKKRSIQREDPSAEVMPEAFANGTNPEERTVHAEEIEHLFNALAQLDERQQKIVHLRFFEGLTYDQIANRLQIKSHIVRNQLGKALEYLQAQLEIDS